MRRFAMMLAWIVVALPAGAGDAVDGCAWLCGSWTLDTARSDQSGPLLDTALQDFRNPGPRRVPRAPRDAALGPEKLLEPSGPSPDEKARTELREQLLEELDPPATLLVDAEPNVLLLRTANGEVRRLYPDEPHSRVTASGTIRISTSWRKDELTVKEAQGRGHAVTETFALQPDDTLQLTLVVDHPGIKPLTLHTIYRRGQRQALESGAQERSETSAP